MRRDMRKENTASFHSFIKLTLFVTVFEDNTRQITKSKGVAMRTMIIFLFTFNLLFAGVGTVAVKALSKPIIQGVTQAAYSTAGKRTLEILGAKYGRKALAKFNSIKKAYGDKGIDLLAHYGDEAVVSGKNAFALVSKHGDDGYYLLARYPSSRQLFGKFDSRYVDAARQFGDGRVTMWLTEAARRNKAEKVLSFLEKYGTKAAVFYEKNWGKLLATGFVILNADTLIASGTEVGKSVIHEGTQAVGNGIIGVTRELLHSDLVYFLGMAILLYILFSLWIKWREYRHTKGEAIRQ